MSLIDEDLTPEEQREFDVALILQALIDRLGEDAVTEELFRKFCNGTNEDRAVIWEGLYVPEEAVPNGDG